MEGKIINVTPAAASYATPYSAGDVIGAINTLSEAVNNSGGSCKIQSLAVLDKSNQSASLDILFFSEAPLNSYGADNAAYALNDADLTKLVGRASISGGLGGDYVSSSTNNAEATLTNLNLIVQAKAGSKNIYMLVVARSAATYGSASSLIVRVGLEKY
jgi:hypothetical protein